MKQRRPAYPLWALLTAFFVLAVSHFSYAGLGGDVSSVQADSVHMKGALRIVGAQMFTVHEIRTAEGTSVREYVNASGKVFGVAWNGPLLPDMQQLLGDYFDQAVQAAKASRTNHKTLNINEPGLVVQSGGHMRSFTGRAYLPDMVPAGMNLESVR